MKTKLKLLFDDTIAELAPDLDRETAAAIVQRTLDSYLADQGKDREERGYPYTISEGLLLENREAAIFMACNAMLHYEREYILEILLDSYYPASERLQADPITGGWEIVRSTRADIEQPDVQYARRAALSVSIGPATLFGWGIWDGWYSQELTRALLDPRIAAMKLEEYKQNEDFFDDKF